jgi:hypothetical protein
MMGLSLLSVKLYRTSTSSSSRAREAGVAIQRLDSWIATPLRGSQ